MPGDYRYHGADLGALVTPLVPEQPAPVTSTSFKMA